MTNASGDMLNLGSEVLSDHGNSPRGNRLGAIKEIDSTTKKRKRVWVPAASFRKLGLAIDNFS